MQCAIYVMRQFPRQDAGMRICIYLYTSTDVYQIRVKYTNIRVLYVRLSMYLGRQFLCQDGEVYKYVYFCAY